MLRTVGVLTLKIWIITNLGPCLYLGRKQGPSYFSIHLSEHESGKSTRSLCTVKSTILGEKKRITKDFSVYITKDFSLCSK